MALNLDAMSRDELMNLRKSVDAALKTLDKRKKKKARAAVEQTAREHGFSLNDILGTKKANGSKKKSSPSKSPPKYANPADSGQTWTGRGPRPGWFRDCLAKGKTPEDMAI
ncbi:MAG: H-NS histone family protein [Rhodobacteraceae bacterium]|nr:H-NS histone family protein [Paracoccaceae bacterium]